MAGMVDRWTSHFTSSLERGKHYLMPVLLDPRTKTKAFSLLPPEHRESAARMVSEEFSLLLASQDGPAPAEQEVTPTTLTPTPPISLWDNSEAAFSDQDELAKYLPPTHLLLTRRYYEFPACSHGLSPVTWFQSHHLHLMVRLFCQWCCTPASAASVERLWSSATFLDDRLRARMSPDLIASRLFIQKNSRMLAQLPTPSCILSETTQ